MLASNIGASLFREKQTV